MTTIRELVTRWGFDINTNPLRNAENHIESLKGEVIAVTTAVTGAAASIWGFASATAAVADKAVKTADKLGISVEALQEFRHAASLSGVDQNTLDAAMQSFVVKTAEAASGTGEAIEALEELKISLRDTSGAVNSPENLLNQVADAMAAIEDPAKRVRLAFKIFETEGLGLINLLKLGSSGMADLRLEARELGLVISEKTAREAEAFNDAYERLFGSLKGIRNEIGGALLPTLTKMADKWREYFLTNRQIIRQDLSVFLSKSLQVLEFLGTAVIKVIEYSREFVQVLGGMKNVVEVGAIALGLLAAKLLYVQLAALGMPALVALIILLLAVLIQDLYNWANGVDSVTQDVIDHFKRLYEWLLGEDNPFERLLKSVIRLFKAIAALDPFRVMISYIDGAGSRLELFQKTLANVADTIKYIFDLFTFMPKLSAEIVSSFVNFLAERIEKDLPLKSPNNRSLEISKWFDPNFSVLSTMTPLTNPLPSNQVLRTDQRVFNNDWQVTVNANPGQDPQEIAKVTADEVDRRMIRWISELERDAYNEVEA